jgi:hypothetical protein
MKIVLNLILLLLITGCSGDTSLKGAFEKQMKEDQADGFNLIHLEDNETDGLALYTSWTDDYPDNKNKPGILLRKSKWEVAKQNRNRMQ